MELNKFMADLESDLPAPGGGSASALVGMISASLGLMVSRLTENRKGYESVNDEIGRIISEMVEVKKLLENGMDEDIEAFNNISRSRKLPKGTDEEKRIRKDAIDSAMKGAISSPWRIAVNCQRSMRLNLRLLKIGNKNAFSDAAAGVILGKASADSVLLNVGINLKYLKDEQYINDQRIKLKLFNEESEKIMHEAQSIIEELMKSKNGE